MLREQFYAQEEIVLKSALKKSTFREIKGTMSRFLSIFGIVAIGAGFFSGVKAAAPDMRLTADKYYDENKLMNFRVVSSYGFNEADIEALREIEGAEVYPAYFSDFMSESSGRQPSAARVFGLGANGDKLNSIILTEGRFPKAADECIVCVSTMKGGAGVGETVVFTNGDGEAPEDIISVNEYKIVGSFKSPMYIDKTSRGSTSVGNGSINAVYFIPEENFCIEYNTEVYLRLPELDGLNCYEQEYKDKIEEITDQIESIGEERKIGRYDEIMSEANEKLTEAKEKLADAEKEANEKIADGEKELAEAKQKLDDAEKEIADNEKKLEDGKAEIADGKQKLITAKQDIADGKAELEKGKEEYREGKAEFDEKKAELESGRKQLDAGKEQLDKAREELETGKQQYEDGKKQLEEGKKQLEEGKEEYRKQILEAQKQIIEGESQIELNTAKLTSAEEQYISQSAELEQSKSLYDSAYQLYREKYNKFYNETLKPHNEKQAALDKERAEYEAAYAAWEVKNNQLEQQKAELDRQLDELLEMSMFDPGYQEAYQRYRDNYTQYISAKAEVDAEKASLAATKSDLDSRQRELDREKESFAFTEAALEETADLLNTMSIKISDGEVALKEARTTLDNGWAELEAGKKKLAEGKLELEWQQKEAEKQFDDAEEKIKDSEKQLAEAKTKIEEGEKQLAEGEKEYKENEKLITDGEKQLAEGEAKLNDAKAEIESAEKKISDGEKEIAENEKKLADAEIEITEGEQKLAEGKEEYEKGLAEYQKGEKEFADGKKEAEDKIADARLEIAKAESDVAKLDKPIWYVFDRSDNPGYSEYGENAQRINNIASVFPVFFVLVAALVCLTTMSRMVEEQRVQIGTLKALGYSNSSIMFKYMFYAVSATVAGSVFGILAGMHLFPAVIISAYGIMYDINGMILNIDIVTALISTFMFMAVVVLAVFMSCKSALGEQAAQLMRPKAPKTGKKILLERIKPLWKGFSFGGKVTARNIFRYKRKMLMTVIGISGCTALLLTGFGLYDSINDIIAKQYGELQHYQGIAVYDGEKYPEAEERTSEILSKYGDHINVYQKMMTVTSGGKNVEAYIAVPKQTEMFTEFLTLRDRKSKELFEFADGKVYIDEKMAQLLGGVQSGDSIEIRVSDSDTVTAEVSGVFENYPMHYVYMTDNTYREIFHERPKYNSIYFRHDLGEEGEDGLAEEILETDGVLMVSYSSTVMNNYRNMLSSLNYVILVIILAAGTLAFIVMYNLTNINITERIREIATLKVLGFYDGEVDGYVFRENIILTLVGAAAGLVLGVFLANFVITTAEVDLVMFGRTIYPLSFILAAVVTMLFSVLVTLFMHKRLMNINMIEALKSVE